jgi:hypothetical protein
LQRGNTPEAREICKTRWSFGRAKPDVDGIETGMHQMRREGLPVPGAAAGGLHRSSTSGNSGGATSGAGLWRQTIRQMRNGSGRGDGGVSDGLADVAPLEAIRAAGAALTSQLSRWPLTAAAVTRNSVRSGLEELRRQHGLHNQAAAAARGTNAVFRTGGAGARRGAGISSLALPPKMTP